ncbi:MAG: tetratricopeptide repeat protein [Saprospiraceae bacterium]
MENRTNLLLESYFANSLSAADAAELKTLAAADPGVAAELGFQRRVAAAVNPLSFAHSIQDTAWREAAQKPFPATAIKVTMWPRYAYAAAAAIALLIAAIIFMQPPTLQTTVANNTTEYPNTMKFKALGGGDAEAVPQIVISAFSLYDEGNYAEAAKALQPIAVANAQRMDYRFYWGVSLVKTAQYTDAVAALTLVAQSQNDYQVPALYYLGLACAGAGDRDCARQNLEAYIGSQNGVTFKKEAQAVLDAL